MAARQNLHMETRMKKVNGAENGGVIRAKGAEDGRRERGQQTILSMV